MEGRPMMQNLEIEFKTQLTPTEFQTLKTQYEPLTAIWQKNIYYDTPDFQLKENHCGLRIRLFADGSAEATLKTPQATGLLETTESIQADDCKKILQQKQFPDFPSITHELNKYKIAVNKLTVFAELETQRFEKKLNELATIMLDQSTYYGKTDYELEMEVVHSEEGRTFYQQFLADHHLKERPMANKIARALSAKKATCYNK